MASRQIKFSTLRCRSSLAVLLAIVSSACAPTDKLEPENDVVVISVLGTNDVHGELLPQPDRGGLTTLSGYIAALRAVRAADNGGMLLIDAGDMWQGTLESNMSEGASVVDAYNALEYTAAAIGNHEFDFGPAGPLATPQNDADDPRGALKLRAMQAEFPLLAANLIDTSTDLPVAWQNVRPSTLAEVAGIRIGIIGVMSENALQITIAANTIGLRVAPLTESIIREARALRANGAALVIVTAHAGSRCDEFDDPLDLSSCRLSGEIMRVASELPPGLVDHIIAGHVHQGIAHIVNGISITSSYSYTRAFSRVDFTIDRRTRTIRSRRVFPPQPACGFVDKASGQCVWDDEGSASIVAARYEGQQIVPTEIIVAIAERAAARVNETKDEKIGVYLETPITLDGRPESALGNLVTDALLESSDADVAIHNVSGGIRANLPQGELTYGSLFRVFPFDNRLVILDVSGADLRRIIARQVHNDGRRAGFSGMRVFVDCNNDQMSVTMLLADGRKIQDDDRIKVVATDFLALGGDNVLTPAMPDGGFQYADNMPMARDIIAAWFSLGGGRIHAEQFLDLENRRWNLPDQPLSGCSL